MIPLVQADPATIGDFTLLGRLGAGGMGQLYLGRRPDGSVAAIKLIRPDLGHQPDFRARFRREIVAAEQADSPHVARVLAADPDGTPPWLGVEYIPGPSLAEAVSEHGPLPEDAARILLAGLCAGLIDLHRLGLVHRDLKPGNVLITAGGPRIIDFGVARVLDSSTITLTGQLLGSPGFMSPEQAIGKDPAGPATDIFALGALMTYAVTGESPFGTGQTPAVVYRVVHEAPGLDGVPVSMRELIAACLAKDPAQRPTAHEVLDRLGPDGLVAAGDWLPRGIDADIRRRVAELESLQAEPETGTVLRSRPRPQPVAEPAPPEPARTSRFRSRPAKLVGAAIVVLALGFGATRLAPAATPTASEAGAAASASAVASVTPPVVASTIPSASTLPVPNGGPAPSALTVPPLGQQQTTTYPPADPPAKPKTPATKAPKTVAPRAADGQTCFATAIQGGFTLKVDQHVAGGPNRTSSKCRDIHIKLTSATWRTYARSCLETSDGGTITGCSRWILLSYPDTWDTLSGSVPANTRWQLQMYAEGDETVRFSYTA